MIEIGPNLRAVLISELNVIDNSKLSEWEFTKALTQFHNTIKIILEESMKKIESQQLVNPEKEVK